MNFRMNWEKGSATVDSDNTKESIRILACGDIMLCGKIEETLENKGCSFPFKDVKPFFDENDLVFCNLEALLHDERNTKIHGKRATFEIKSSSLDCLLNIGFNLINIGNNHSVDFGRHQVTETKKYIKAKNAYVIGGGENLADAHDPEIIEKNGIKLAVFGYAKKDEQLNADSSNAGNTGFVLERVIDDIKKVRERVDVVIVSVHWGWEFVNYPDPDIQFSFRKVIEAGADVIIGHHPHFINGMEVYKNKPIFYSIGSFLVEYEPHLSDYELGLFETSFQNNIMVQLDITKDGVSAFNVIPVEMTTDFKVRPEHGEQKAKTLSMFEEYSKNLEGDRLKKIFFKNSRNHLMIQFPAFRKMLKINGILAVETILLWMSKPIIIKMLAGNFLRINLPDLFVKVIRLVNLVLYKLVSIINLSKRKKGITEVDIFAEPLFSEQNK